MYTVNHKKVAFYFRLTLANLNRLLYFLYHFNREDILHATAVKFAISRQRFELTDRQKFGVMTLFDLLTRLTVKMSSFENPKMADGRHLGKIERSPYIRNSLTNRHEIWYGDAVPPSWPL